MTSHPRIIASSHHRIIFLAAGGTGGHIFPAIALGEQLAKQGYHPILVTDKRFRKYQEALNTGGTSPVKVATILAGSLAGNPLRKIIGLITLTLGTLQALFLMLRYKPHAVVGFGGYPSFPTMFAALLLGKRTIIHEQNAILGRANRVLAARVDRIATSYAGTEGMDHTQLAKAMHTGNPVRAAVQALQGQAYPDIAAGNAITLLVTGGSQGASIFAEVVPAAIAALPEELRKNLRVIQQCRQSELAEVKEQYQTLGVQAELATFFSDIPAKLAQAHLVISRSGASSVAELVTAGRPAILVPYPHATDNHQTANADLLAGAGGGWVMAQPQFTIEALSQKLHALLTEPKQLALAAEKAAVAGKVNAAKQLAELVTSY